MRVRKLSPSGDYTFGQSALNFFVNTPVGVAQVVKTSLLLWLGEYFWDISQGMPWIQGVLGKHSQRQADATIQNYVLQVPNVTGIVAGSFTSSLNTSTRFYSASFKINTAFGPTEVQIENYLNY